MSEDAKQQQVDTDVETSEEDVIDAETEQSDSGVALSQDPYELSKSGTGSFHPAANESLRRYIRLILAEKKHGY